MTAVRGHEAHVVKHRAGIQQFRIVVQGATLAGQRRPVVDAAGMMKQQRRLGIAHEFGDFAGQLAVWNGDVANGETHDRLLFGSG
ncbi:hypothetical protein GCM10009080_39510 [Cupriavidus pauculus]